MHCIEPLRAVLFVGIPGSKSVWAELLVLAQTPGGFSGLAAGAWGPFHQELTHTLTHTLSHTHTHVQTTLKSLVQSPLVT